MSISIQKYPEIRKYEKKTLILADNLYSALRTLYNDQSICPSFHPSAHLSIRDLLSGEYLLSSWSNIAYTSLTIVSMFKGCAVTLNGV